MTKLSQHFELTNPNGLPILGYQIGVSYNPENGIATPIHLLMYSYKAHSFLNMTLMMHEPFWEGIVREAVNSTNWYSIYLRQEQQNARLADNIRHGIEQGRGEF